MEKCERDKLFSPNKGEKILLHSCCAPCSGEIMEALHDSGFDVTVFYYNPNVFPKQEYEKRKTDNKRFADKLNMKFFDADYENDLWLSKMQGLENEPERGQRCSKCFDLRLEKTALFAWENGFNLISSTLGMARWKDLDQVNQSGLTAVSPYEGLEYWTYNWRKKGGSKRMYEIARRENFYRQKYCGCIYSLSSSKTSSS